jgi:hypothetical protein
MSNRHDYKNISMKINVYTTNPKSAFQAEILIVKLMQNKKENSRHKLCEIQQLDESMAKSKTTYFSLLD